MADVQVEVEVPCPARQEVEEWALERLGWSEKPIVEGFEYVDRYLGGDGNIARMVVDMATRASNGSGAVGLLKEWAEYPKAAILRLVEFEQEKRAGGDPVRSPSKWWKPTLEGIMEVQGEAYL